MPIHAPADLEAQYSAVTVGAGLTDLSDRGKIEVTGPDAVEYLQGQITNDVVALSAGEGCYAAMLTPKGRIVSDARILVRADDIVWIDVEASAVEAALHELRTYKIGRQVEVRERTADRALLSLAGARSPEIVANVAGGAELPTHEHGSRELRVADALAVMVRTAVGFDLFLDPQDKRATRDALIDSGAQAVDDRAAELVRIELGIPRFGVDMTLDNLPGEAGIVERAVSFTKGCYVGQEPVARMFHKGHPNRYLRGLRLSEPIASGAPLLHGGSEVGRLSSTGISPKYGPIGLAVVRKEAVPGTELAIADSTANATVVELPFGGK